MDIWLLLSMMFVALAIFQYAVLLAIRFRKAERIHVKMERGATKKKVQCRKMDSISLKVFMGLYILAVGSYFYTVVIHIL